MGLGTVLGQMPTAWSPGPLSLSGSCGGPVSSFSIVLYRHGKCLISTHPPPHLSAPDPTPALVSAENNLEADWRTNTFTPHLYSCVIPETIRIL